MSHTKIIFYYIKLKIQSYKQQFYQQRALIYIIIIGDAHQFIVHYLIPSDPQISTAFIEIKNNFQWSWLTYYRFTCLKSLVFTSTPWLTLDISVINLNLKNGSNSLCNQDYSSMYKIRWFCYEKPTPFFYFLISKVWVLILLISS